LAPSRTLAREAVESGLVKVDSAVVTKPSRSVGVDSLIEIDSLPHPYVGRGGVKLRFALDAFRIDVAGMACLDVGSSTGGFTDCLLQAGAARVVCVDVGTGQLDPRLRLDPRVTAFERTNIKDVDPGTLGGPFDLVVVDLSFISVCSVASRLAQATSYQSIVLCKPQYEVGRDRLRKRGLVKDAAERERAVQGVVACLAAEGLGTRAMVPSPITGRDGNREFLLWVERGQAGGPAEDKGA
jgi:23S rRNA (cytidine1920-2'-O)/16S rRNA (cytidine1409-2'-O)-methyltransferase